MPAALMVTYPADAGATFDRDYYAATHLPLVRETFGRYGLVAATGYFPESEGTPHLAVAVLSFRDADARAAALGSTDAATVFGDVSNFTNTLPTPTALAVA
ncbi:EthD family reductase [Sphingomonas sp.]|uniref:EthD family reductase n=1 Tax=Sphingomonas sp. TaxID=28214 RepID=UPI0035C7D90D